MFGAILSVVGAVGGFCIGGPAGAAIGASIGGSIGSAIDGSGGGSGNSWGGGRQHVAVKLPTSYGPKLSDLRTTTSSYGGVIPKIYGNMRLAGNIIWAAPLRETSKEKEEKLSGSLHVTTTQINVTYEYFATLAIAICEGEINEIARIWAGDKMLDLSKFGNDRDGPRSSLR